jgi:hypothetical protein
VVALADWLRIGLVALLALAAPALDTSTRAAPPRSVTLSDGWLFQPDPNGVGDAQRWQRPDLDRRGWRAVKVPMAWDFYDPVMDGYEGVGWYALALPADRVVAGSGSGCVLTARTTARRCGSTGRRPART